QTCALPISQELAGAEGRSGDAGGLISPASPSRGVPTTTICISTPSRRSIRQRDRRGGRPPHGLGSHMEKRRILPRLSAASLLFAVAAAAAQAPSAEDFSRRPDAWELSLSPSG